MAKSRHWDFSNRLNLCKFLQMCASSRLCGGVACLFVSVFFVFGGITSANAALITSISGNLSTIFPYISGNAADGAQPMFYQTFKGANITSIPDTLFSGYTVASTHMFSGTFSGCTGLTSIPENLFFPNADPKLSSTSNRFYDGGLSFLMCVLLWNEEQRKFSPSGGVPAEPGGGGTSISLRQG